LTNIIFTQLVYAAQYLLEGVHTQLDRLDGEGYTSALQGNIVLFATQGGAPCALMEVGVYFFETQN
jgi:hypothetical protein